MLKIGLTGGIGAGKTTVAKIFETLGIPVYYADQEAKRLMETNAELIKTIKNQFGESTYSDGKLNRKILAEIIFTDKEKLAQLNSIVHPFTIQDGIRWMSDQTCSYAIKEAALIFESGSRHEFDFIIGVSAPSALRFARTMERDHETKAHITERMDNQMDETIKMNLCDAVINNDEEQLLIPQVIALHEKLVKMSGEASTHG